MKLKHIGPGMYEDEQKTLHVCVPELLEHFGIPPTPENIEALAKASAEVAKRKSIPHEDAGREPWGV